MAEPSDLGTEQVRKRTHSQPRASAAVCEPAREEARVRGRHPEGWLRGGGGGSPWEPRLHRPGRRGWVAASGRAA